MYISYHHPIICSSPQETKLYEEVTSLDDLSGVVEAALEEYNNTHKNRMDLVIFRYLVSYQDIPMDLLSSED